MKPASEKQYQLVQGQLENLVEAVEDLVEEEVEESSTPQAGGFNLKPYLRTLLRKLPLIVGITGTTTVMAFMVASKDPDTYSGSFRLLVEPLSSEEKLTDVSTLARTKGVPDQNLLSLDYPTQIEILTSSEIIEQIAEKVANAKIMDEIARELGENRQAFNKNYLADNIRSNLRVERVSAGLSSSDKTKIIAISYQATNPKLVQLILDVTSKYYLDYSLEQRQENINAGVKFIDAQIKTLEKRSKELQLQLQTFQDRYKIVDPSSRTQELFNQIHAIKNQQIEVFNQLQEFQKLNASLQQQLGLNSNEALVASNLNEDPERQNLLSKIQELDSQIAIVSAKFTDNDPRLQDLENQKQNLVELLQRRTTSILTNIPQTAIANPQIYDFQNGIRMKLIAQSIDTANQIDIFKLRYQLLEQTRLSVEADARKFPEITRQYSQIQQQLSLNNDILNQLLSQRETLRVEAAQRGFPWKLISKPQLPINEYGQPVSYRGNPKKKIMAGLIGGLLLSSAIAILWEKLRNIFYTVADVKDLVPFEFLGNIIVYHHGKSQKSLDNFKSWLGTTHEEQQPLNRIEGFDLLYAKLRFLNHDFPIRSLVVCSVEPGDIQSNVAFNLAQIAVAKDEQVLLIDFNGSQAQFYNWSHSQSNDLLLEELDNLMNQQELTEQEQMNLPFKRWSFDASLNNNQKTIMWSKRIWSIMKKLHEQYDLVIYNSCPFFESYDINFIAEHTDGILMVTEIAKTSQSMVQKAVKQINEFQLPTVGLVAVSYKK